VLVYYGRLDYLFQARHSHVFIVVMVA
jgi:hypothetical protein